MRRCHQIPESEQLDIINNQDFLKLVFSAQSQAYNGLTLVTQARAVPTSAEPRIVFQIFSYNELLSRLKINNRNPLSKFKDEIAQFSVPMLLKLYDTVKEEKHMVINGVEIKYPAWEKPHPKYQVIGIIYQTLREKLRNAPAIISTSAAFMCHEYGRNLLCSDGENARKMIRRSSYYYYAKHHIRRDLSGLKKLFVTEKKRQEKKGAVSKAELLDTVLNELNNKILVDRVIRPLALTVFLEEKLQQLIALYEREVTSNESRHNLAFSNKTSIQLLRAIIGKLCGQYLEKKQLAQLVERLSPLELLNYTGEGANENTAIEADIVVAEPIQRGQWPFFEETPAHAEAKKSLCLVPGSNLVGFVSPWN